LLELERNRSAAERDAERAEAERRVSELRTEEARRIRELELAARQREAETPYRRWLEQDVVYIIAHEEKAAFERLKTDEERAKFIEQFWQRRDPTPAAAPNEFKEEHYRRIAYANERFRTGEVHGWRTDRGRIYIVNGPPDEIETHPGSREAWRYKSGLRTFEFTLPGGVLKGIAVPLGR
jgi:GWxTD domain-containing protein